MISIGADPHLEVLTEDGLFSIDMVGTWNGRCVAVEANGPTHYLREPAGVMTGNKLLRDVFIARRGYHVVNLPVWLWSDCNDNVEEQEQLVRRLLDEGTANLGPVYGKVRLPVGQRI